MWEIRGDAEAVRALQKQHPDLNPLLARVLAARGLAPGPALTHYLQVGSLPEPSYAGLPGMAVALARVQQALEQRERIVICGDYDIDGITATALLLRSLRQHGANVDYFLPQRQS